MIGLMLGLGLVSLFVTIDQNEHGRLKRFELGLGVRLVWEGGGG